MEIMSCSNVTTPSFTFEQLRESIAALKNAVSSPCPFAAMLKAFGGSPETSTIFLPKSVYEKVFMPPEFVMAHPFIGDVVIARISKWQRERMRLAKKDKPRD